MVSADDDRLFGGSGVAASPFVIALNDAGINGLPDFLNVVIIVGISAIGAESIYVASRQLRAMAHQRLIPGWIAKVDDKGRPRVSILITCFVAVILTYMNLSAGGITVFNWLANITSTAYFMVWVVISITSFRFRAALKAQNDPLFSEIHSWSCSYWPLPPIWLGLCCSLYTGCAIYLGLFPVVRGSRLQAIGMNAD